jgi:4a-hydroxytetrahydrobiopterin dehydratase
MASLPDWKLSDDGKSISRKWQLKNFVQAVKLIQQAADIAEDEQHHPDLHLTGYRNLEIVLTTHAIDGLSENDFIVAAKIDQVAS